MNKKNVLSIKQLPTRLPITPTAIAYLLLEQLHASQVWWGVVGTLIAIVWICCVVGVVKEKQVEIDLVEKT